MTEQRLSSGSGANYDLIKAFSETVETITATSPEPISFEVGTYLTAGGELITLENHATDYADLTSPIKLGSSTVRFTVLDHLRQRVNEMCEGSAGSFVRALGYDHLTGDAGESSEEGLTVIPSTDYLNSSRLTIYDGYGTPPLTFESSATSEIDASDFIHALAERKVILSGLKDLYGFSTEVSSQVPGYNRLNAGLFNLIARVASELSNDPAVLETVDDAIPGVRSSDFVYYEPRSFLKSVQELASLLSRYPTWNNHIRREVKDRILNIIYVSDLSHRSRFIRRRQAGAYFKDLMYHQQWLNKRVGYLALR